MHDHLSDGGKEILREERVREDFVHDVMHEWVLNDDDEFPT